MTAHRITSPEQLAALYPNPIAPASVLKEIDHIDANYGALIAASPFFVLATNVRTGWIAHRAGISRALSLSATRERC